MRYDGKSIAEIAKAQIGDKVGLATSFAVLFLNILAMAGMAVVIVNALHDSPWGTFTIGMTIPIAIFVGIYMQFLRPGHIKEGTIIGVALTLLAVILGPSVSLRRHWHRSSPLTPRAFPSPHHLRFRRSCPSGMAAPGTA